MLKNKQTTYCKVNENIGPSVARQFVIYVTNIGDTHDTIGQVGNIDKVELA